MTEKRIDQLSREEKREIQRDMIRVGFMDPLLPSGDPADDGIWGPVTIDAYSAYWASRPQVEISVPIVTPAPVLPWWLSKGAWGSLIAIVAGIAALAGHGFDAKEATDAIMPIVELAPQVIAVLGGLLAWWGRRTAKAPIDPTLVARVGGYDVRVPRLRRDRVPAASGSEPRDPFGHFGE